MEKSEKGMKGRVRERERRKGRETGEKERRIRSYGKIEGG